jgi:hypothetical protein
MVPNRPPSGSSVRVVDRIAGVDGDGLAVGSDGVGILLRSHERVAGRLVLFGLGFLLGGDGLGRGRRGSGRGGSRSGGGLGGKGDVA